MKKLFAMLLAVVMVLSMAACGGSSAPAATEAPAATQAPAAAPAAPHRAVCTVHPDFFAHHGVR